MKELQYPFDSGYLLKKKRSIKKQLLADDMPRVEKKIAVLGGSTANDIVDITELFLLDYGIKPQFYLSEYNRYWQDAVFDNPELQEFAPDIVFIHTTNKNILAYPDINSTKEEVDKLFSEQLAHFETMWKAIADKYHCPIIQNNFEQPYFRLMGNRDCFDYRGRVNYINRLNMAFADYAESHEGFYINDINYLSACYGIDNWSDPAAWHMYKYAMCIPAIPDFAFNLAGIIKSIFGKNRKSLVLDLDNTLWGGVVGDDGVDGIEIGQETHMGQVYSEFQKYLALVKNTGVMLTVCSKNDEENAIAGLKHPEGSLKPEDFIVIKANWENKDRNIVAIANELNIGLDALVFLDDNPAERAIVSSQLPMVAVPEMTAPEEYIKTVDRSHFFEITSFSGDDLKRNEMYKKNAERAALQSQFADYGEYLTSLDMVGVIDDFLPIYLPRITQLTNKSNQFNLTTRRFTTSEMEEVFADDSYIRLYGKLTDKFGDNGIVSVVIGKINGDTLDVILWLMSCRVLKRDMEYAMLDNLVERAQEKGIKEIKGYYYPTAKNKMVKELYADFGFDKISEDEEGNTVWSLKTEGYNKKNNYIKVERNKEND
ncbi:MAG: HAD-IIIC family phosphatase [Ruminococcaceae bacterium]|nr:HAD-IIIC family phosphatase [Oscillospiraceae bacterium]